MQTIKIKLSAVTLSLSVAGFKSLFSRIFVILQLVSANLHSASSISKWTLHSKQNCSNIPTQIPASDVLKSTWHLHSGWSRNKGSTTHDITLLPPALQFSTSHFEQGSESVTRKKDIFMLFAGLYRSMSGKQVPSVLSLQPRAVSQDRRRRYSQHGLTKVGTTLKATFELKLN